MRNLIAMMLIAGCGKSEPADPDHERAPQAAARDATATADARSARAERQAHLDAIGMKGIRATVGQRDDEAIIEGAVPGTCLMILTAFYGDFVEAMKRWGFHAARCSPEMFADLDIDQPKERLATATWLIDEHRQAELGARFGVHATKDIPIAFVLGDTDELFILADCDAGKLLKIANDASVANALAEHSIRSLHCLNGKSLRLVVAR